MYLNDNPFASLSGFNGQMAGPSGFAGGFDPNALGSPLVQPNKKRHGVFGGAWPLFGLAGLLSHTGGLGSVAPLLGGLAGFGISRMMK